MTSKAFIPALTRLRSSARILREALDAAKEAGAALGIVAVGDEFRLTLRKIAEWEAQDEQFAEEAAPVYPDPMDDPAVSEFIEAFASSLPIEDPARIHLAEWLWTRTQEPT